MKLDGRHNCVADGSWLSVDPASSCARCNEGKLTSCSLITSHPGQDFEALARRSTHQTGETLFTDRDSVESVYVVVSGMVRCSKYLSSGRRYVAAFMGPGDLLGVVNSQTHPYTAECVTPAEICRFSKKGFSSLLAKNPDLKQRILNSVSNELVEAQTHAMLLANESAKARAAAFILLMRNRQSRRSSAPDHVDLPMSRRDIADYLGVAHETMSRALQGLAADGLIEIERPTQITVKDPAGLALLTGESLDVLEDVFTASAPTWALL